MNKKVYLIMVSILAVVVGADSALAADGGSGASSLSAIGAALAIGLGVIGGTFGQAKAVTAALDSIGRNPAAAGKIFTPMVIGLALIESLVILSFVIAISLT